jgi:tRNA(fMet)-specific endonuclease VapC
LVFLDTDILVSLLRGSSDALRRIGELERRGELLSTTSITAYELLKGARTSSHSEENVRGVERLLVNMKVEGFGEEDSPTAALIFAQLKEKGKMVGEFDMIIASIVIGRNDRLLSRDKHFETVPGLKFETW